MSWNNRIFRHKFVHRDGSVSYSYAIHEAFYHENKKQPHSWTETAMCGHYDSVDDLIKGLEKMLKDAKRFKNDVLDYEPKKRKKKTK